MRRQPPGAAPPEQRCASARCGLGGGPVKKIPPGAYNYQRRHVRPGDETVNSPKKTPQGERLTYTASGVTVNDYAGAQPEAASQAEIPASR